MHVQARASIDLQGTVLRYAEVERYGARYRLLRLGSCDFDFDAASELLADEAPPHLDVVADAIADVFEGSSAAHLRVALHPPAGHAFFTPLPADLAPEARRKRLEVEALLLTDAEASHALRLGADSVYHETLDDGRTLEWYHVFAVSARTQERFEHVLRAFPRAHRRLTTSMSGVAALVAQLETVRPRPDEAPPYSLALGVYDGIVEYTLCQGVRWRFAHYAHASAPSDVVYYATALLARVGLRPRDVGRLLLYGDAPDPALTALLEAVFGREAAPIDPLAVVDLDPGSLAASFDATGYTPAVGAAL